MIKNAKIELRPDYAYNYTFQKQSLQKTSVHVVLGTSINHGSWNGGVGGVFTKSPYCYDPT